MKLISSLNITSDKENNISPATITLSVKPLNLSYPGEEAGKSLLHQRKPRR